MQALIDRLLTEHAIEPVLVDVGASGGTPRIWQPIRKHSAYIGFDADSREIREIKSGEFKSAMIINEVVTADADATAAHFFLTRSPYCSSTLHPNPLVTENFLSADSFIIESESTAQASTLNAIFQRLNVSHIDWLKLDTQGCDLRIFESLGPDLRDKLLAVDLEPGLRGAYVGEDLFSDVHKKLTAEGYWLSDLKVCGLVRMRKATLSGLASTRPDLDADTLARCVRPTPGWTECRYLRSLESLAGSDVGRREYLLLFVVALIDKQHGFCLDLSVEYGRRFGADQVARLLRDQALACIDQAQARLTDAEGGRVRASQTLYQRLRRKVRAMLSLASHRVL